MVRGRKPILRCPAGLTRGNNGGKSPIHERIPDPVVTNDGKGDPSSDHDDEEKIPTPVVDGGGGGGATKNIPEPPPE